MTTHKEPVESAKRRTSVLRRRFLGGLGASGLATAAAVFGGERAANAYYTAGCCTLAYAPTVTVSQCINTGRYYMWTCSNPQYPGDRVHACDCCEVKNSSGGFISSGYRCYP